MISLDLVKDVTRIIWIQDYDEDGAMKDIKNVFKDYKIHIWNSVSPSMFGITVTEDINSDLHRFIYWALQRFAGKDVLVIMDFDAYVNDYKVLRAIRLSRPYLEKKDCYIICLSPLYVHNEEYNDSYIHNIKSIMFILNRSLKFDKNEIMSIIDKECANIGIDPKDAITDDSIFYTLSYNPKPTVEMMVRLSLRATGRIDKNLLEKM